MWSTLYQDGAVASLEADLAAARPAHAYLFTGPPHTGKATLARELAMALNCDGDTAAHSPCHTCRSCRRIEEGKHADVQVLSVDSPCEEQNDREHDHARRPATMIRLCQVRRVRRAAAEAPFEGRWRAIIIDPADQMNYESANALLKTLEEPPPQVVFLLITAREEAIPETVRSRCRRVESRSVPLAEINDYLVAQLGLPQTEADTLARLSRGRIGWTITAAGDSLARRREVVEGMVRLAGEGRIQRLHAAADLARLWSQDRPAVREVLEVWAEWWRDLLLVVAGRANLVAHLDLQQLAADEAARYSATQVIGFLETIQQIQANLEENANPRLALEVLLLALPLKTRKEVPARP